MISIELIRRDPATVREAMRKRDYDASAIDKIVDLDTQRRSSIVQIDELRARRNEVSQQIGRSGERSPELIDEMRQVGRRISELERGQRVIDADLDTLLLAVPNVPDGSAPVGQDDSSNIEVKRVGDLPSFDFEPQAHWGHRRASGDSRLRAWSASRGISLLRTSWPGSQAAASADLVHARHARRAARLHPRSICRT